MKCKICPKEFNSSPSEKRKYCSYECAYLDHDRVLNSIKACSKKIDLVCPQCHKGFNTTTSSYKQRNDSNIFCSKKCYSQSVIITKECPNCNKSFSGIKSKTGRQKFCSRLCANENTYKTVLSTPAMRKRVSMTRRNNGSYRASVQYSHSHAGRRPDLNNIYFRSAWEANYARYLNLLISQGHYVKWEFEVDTFWFLKIMRGVRSYTPDFKVWRNDGTFEYHEVKGWMDPKSITKIKRMKIYYPQIKMVIIDAKRYKGIADTVKFLIDDWEGRITG